MKRWRAVLAGCGQMSGAWLTAVRDISELEIVGLVDLREDAARARATEFGLNVPVGTDLAVVLDATRAEILFDCTIPEAHHDNALTAFARGVHVLGEKPLAHSLEHARAMVEAAKAAGCTHAVVQNRRFDPNIRRLSRFVKTEQLGAVTTLNADFYIGAHFGGFRDSMRDVLLLDMAIHTFDAARLLLGCDPVSVYCLEWNPQGSWYAHGSSAVCVFQMSDGSVFNYRGSWCSEGFDTTWEADWRVIGTRGSLRWDGAESLTASVVSRAPTRSADGGWSAFGSQHRQCSLPPADPQDTAVGHEGTIRNFLAALRDGSEPETVSSDNIKSLAMVFAAIESARLERKVAVRWN